MIHMNLIHIDSKTLVMTDLSTGEPLDALAIVPGYAPDMACMVNMLSSDEARELEYMAALRAKGVKIQFEASE